MRFLVHNSCHAQTAQSLKAQGHVAVLQAESGPAADAPPQQVLEHCRKHQLELVTRLREHVEAAGGFNRVLVLLSLDALADAEHEALAHDDAIERLLTRFKRLTPGQCYVVTPQQVKAKQLPRVSY